LICCLRAIMIALEAEMAQILIRKVDEHVKSRLRRRAERNGRSMEAEVREIINNACVGDEAPSGGLGSEMAALFSESGIYLDEPIKEIRGMRMEIPDFK
jgi:plasmid stability protein